MIEITTAARLHFGLLSPGPAAPGERRFGGAGMMVDRPGIRLHATPAADWTAEGPLAERALTFARTFAAFLADDTGLIVPPQRLMVETASPPHAGLGSGTQLGMAVARALARAAGRPDLPAEVLARWVGRGLRSGLGVHGFAQGGFLVDAGQKTEGTLAPLVARIDVPPDWRVVLVLPPAGSGWHGAREQQAFDQLSVVAPAITERLCRLLLLGLLPSLAEADLEVFGEALFEFNALAGEFFAPLQGGIYATPQVAERIAFLRREGVRGAGQSSWGPAVFAVVGDEERAADLAARLVSGLDLAGGTVISARPCNHGALSSG
jgi:beta-RFAP synthase